MTTSNRRRWYELSLLALACWAATATHDAHAAATLSGVAPLRANASIKVQAVANTSPELRPLAMTLAGALSIGLLMRRRGGGDRRDR